MKKWRRAGSVLVILVGACIAVAIAGGNTAGRTGTTTIIKNDWVTVTASGSKVDRMRGGMMITGNGLKVSPADGVIIQNYEVLIFGDKPGNDGNLNGRWDVACGESVVFRHAVEGNTRPGPLVVVSDRLAYNFGPTEGTPTISFEVDLLKEDGSVKHVTGSNTTTGGSTTGSLGDDSSPCLPTPN